MYYNTLGNKIYIEYRAITNEFSYDFINDDERTLDNRTYAYINSKGEAFTERIGEEPIREPDYDLVGLVNEKTLEEHPEFKL